MKKGLITVEDNAPLGREITIIRHGQTLLNKEDRIRAWLDVPLDKEGINQALDLGVAMVNEQVELDGIFTSDLQRSIHTSILISQVTGIPLLGETKALRPINVGTYSGTDGKKAHAVIADAARNRPDEEIGGGESFNTYRFRMLGGIIGILNSHRGEKLGFCTHSRGERLLNAWIAAGCPSDLSIDFDVFLEKGEGTATAQILKLDCPLVLS